jgi:histidyl-tRNA synthetase
VSEIKKIKPSLSKGTRDFLPGEVAKRNYIFDTIKSVFRKYGFQEIETPAIERLETLTGKYGEEGDKLLFKILNSGDYLKDVPADKLQRVDSKELLNDISEKGLRYDLTVPLARYVVMHQEELPMPFKRFHIGPVWRADRPQKGRYQEFYQCDADVIGSNSLLNEVELTEIYLDVFQRLGFTCLIAVNHRLLLEQISIWIGVKDHPSVFATAIDKIDKIGLQGVILELKEKYTDLNEAKLGSLTSTVSNIIDNRERLKYIVSELEMTEDTPAIAAILKIIDLVKSYHKVKLVFDPLLARGLDYYTGIIWEVKPGLIQFGSLGGGGRYDNLTEMFGGQNMSGVGISFGIERIYDVMEELKLFPETIETGVKVLLVPRNEGVEDFTFQQTQILRDAGIPAEIFLGNVKKQKQFKYADDKNIPYLIEVGEDERQTSQFRMRNTQTRETQNNLSLAAIINLLK